MAVTLVATIGGAASNSYVDVAAADAYFNNRLNVTAWDGVTDADNKSRALIQATEWIDAFTFVGARTSTTQRLSWPRNPDDDAFEDDEIPLNLQRATFELALHLLRAGETDPLAPSGLESFGSIQVGPIDLSIRSASASGGLPPVVKRLLRDLLGVGFGQFTITRG